MHPDSQIVIPESFIALFVPPGRARPSEPAGVIAQRYELCEDMAALLSEQARELEWKLGIGEQAVLERIAQGLSHGDLALAPPEQGWVAARMAELLGWPWTPPVPGPDSAV